MYNLLYYQVIVKLCTTLTETECDQIITKYATNETIEFCGFSNLGSVMAFVLNNLDRCKHLRTNLSFDDDSNSTSFASTSSATMAPSTSSSSSASTSQQQINLNLWEQQLQKMCLPFLRIAALLRHHLYEQSLPEINVPQMEFVCLVYYLELVTIDINWDSFDAAKALCFVPGMERKLPETWCEQLMALHRESMEDSSRTVATLITNQHGLWQQPKLLSLPREYERLFTVSFHFILNSKLCFIKINIISINSIIMRKLVQTVVIFQENVRFVCCAEQSFV